MKVEVVGRVRQPYQGIDQCAPGSDGVVAGLSEQGSMLTAIDSSAYEEITRLGHSFQVHTTTATASVVATPTTAHGIAIYNNEPDDGKIMVIDAVWSQNVVSTAVASQAQLIGNVGQAREAAPTSAALAITALNGMGGSDTKARTILAATALSAAMGVVGAWFPLGPSVGKPGAAGTPGYGTFYDVNGRIIVPPGRFFALNTMANVVGETFIHGIFWHERNSKLL